MFRSWYGPASIACLTLPSCTLTRHAPLHRIRPATTCESARCVAGEAGAEACLKERDVLRRHRFECRADAWAAEDRGPVVVEIGEGSLHGEFASFDRLQARRRPQVMQ